MGRRRLVVMYLVRSGEGSVIDRLRGDDAATATRRVEKQEAGQDKNRRLGSGRVSIKGPAFSPFFLFSSSLDMKWDFFYLSLSTFIYNTKTLFPPGLRSEEQEGVV